MKIFWLFAILISGLSVLCAQQKSIEDLGLFQGDKELDKESTLVKLLSHMTDGSNITFQIMKTADNILRIVTIENSEISVYDNTFACYDVIVEFLKLYIRFSKLEDLIDNIFLNDTIFNIITNPECYLLSLKNYQWNGNNFDYQEAILNGMFSYNNLDKNGNWVIEKDMKIINGIYSMHVDLGIKLNLKQHKIDRPFHFTATCDKDYQCEYVQEYYVRLSKYVSEGFNELIAMIFLESFHSPKCELSCNENLYDPICGSYGMTYTNRCLFNQTLCDASIMNLELKMSCEGLCPCENDLHPLARSSRSGVASIHHPNISINWTKIQQSDDIKNFVQKGNLARFLSLQINKSFAKSDKISPSKVSVNLTKLEPAMKIENFFQEDTAPLD